MLPRASIALWLSMGCLCQGTTQAQSAEPPGGMLLLPGYEHERQRGIDTLVGRIWKKDGLVIHYDIGRLAGNYAQSRGKDNPAWSKEQTVGGRKVQVCLTRDRV